jgi:hypothetical protein
MSVASRAPRSSQDPRGTPHTPSSTPISPAAQRHWPLSTCR